MVNYSSAEHFGHCAISLNFTICTFEFVDSFSLFDRILAQSVGRLFAGIQPRGQLAVDAINSYQSVVRLLNESLQMALAANRTLEQTTSLLSSVDELAAAVNQSVSDSRALQQTTDQLRSCLSTSGWSQHLRPSFTDDLLSI